MADAERSAGERVDRRAVGGAIVGKQALHGDPVASEEGDCAPQETGCGRGAFVVEDLDVGEAAVVVDRDVDVVPAGVSGAAAVDCDLALAGAAAADAVTDTAADAAELLDVDVDELAGA